MMTYDVLLTQRGIKYVACVRQWPAVMAEGDTEEEAIRKVRGSLKCLLSEARIVQLEMEDVPEEHPWKQFAGMFSHDSDWDAFQAAVRQYRKEQDGALGED